MPASTRRTARSETHDDQSSQQDGGMGVSPTQGPNQSSDNRETSVDEIDVHRPMGLRKMQEIVDNQLLSTEQLRVLADRIRQLVKARIGKRANESTDDEDDRPRKRRADHDLKYNNIKELKTGASLKAWSDWKIEIQRAFDASLYKYDNDRTKVIKALIHLSEDCKTIWNNHIRTAPDDEYNWEAFMNWLNTTIRDQGNDEIKVQIEWSKARQKFDQTPWAFDAYLTSLEREMEPKNEHTRAMEFFSRLRQSLQRAIRLSGINPLPQTRQAMLSLATRMWEEIKHDERDPRKKDLKKQEARTDSSPTQPNLSKHPSKMNHRNEDKNQTVKPKSPKEFASGKNEKGE